MAEKITWNCCQGWGCHERCMIETHTVDGKIVRTQKSRLPFQIDAGVQICQKGACNYRVPYNEERLLKPLKRTGERGEGKFEEISWDQALDEIAEKINWSVESFGPRSVVVMFFYCGVPANRCAIGDRLSHRYVNTLGCSCLEGMGVDYASVIGDCIDEGIPVVGGRFNIMNQSNYVIIWGGNPVGFTRPARLTRMFLDAKERGAKLVHISNMFDNTSAKADQWVQVRSATDASLALSMAHVLVRDGLVNEDWLIRETAAPILVRTDTGKYLRESDVVEEGSPMKFGIVDETSGNVVFVDFQQARGQGWNGYTPKLSVKAAVDGIECRSSYAMLIDHLKAYSPESQEAVTGVPAATVEQIAHEYAEHSPSMIALGNGLRYTNGTQSWRAIKLLTYLTGNHGEPNGGTIITAGIDDSLPTALDYDVVAFDESLPKDLGSFVWMDQVIKSHDNLDDQQYKVLLIAEGNPLLNWPNRELWAQRVLPKFETVVAFEIRMTDTCRFADYVLPEATTFERYEVLGEVDNCVTLCEPAIEPVGDSRVISDIWRGIAERTGVGQYFQKDQEEWCKAVIENQPKPLSYIIDERIDPSRVGEKDILTWDILKEYKAVHMDVPDVPPDPYAVSPLFFTETGRLQFYSELHSDDPFYVFAAQNNTYCLDEVDKQQYPLHLFIGRHKYFMQGQFTNIPEMRELGDINFGVAMNPVEAAKRGLKDGDLVDVYNQRGTMRVPLQLREDMPPGMAHTWYSFPETVYEDEGTCCPQMLATPQNAPELERPWAIKNGERWMGVQIAAGIPNTSRFISGNTTAEVIFDQLCEVEKAEV